MLIQVDLKRNPMVADLISDMQMGDSVSFITSLKSKTGDLAEFTLDRAEEGPVEDKTGDGTDEGDEGEGEGESVNTGNGAGGSANTPGGSKEQDRMAAALTAQI